MPGARRRIHPKHPKSEYWLDLGGSSSVVKYSEEGFWINWDSESDCGAKLFLLNLLSLLSLLCGTGKGESWGKASPAPLPVEQNFVLCRT